MKYEFIEHTADVQFRAYGKTIEEAFVNSAIAMTKSICEDPIKIKKEIEINVLGNDLESLLYNFLEELIFLFDSEHFLLGEIKNIEIDQDKLKAILVGDSGEKYEIFSHVKAITYNEMFVREEQGKWICQVTLDV